MGGCLSSESSREASYNKIIRVVHLNGNLDFFEPPVMVGQVITTATNNPSNKYFLCTAKQLLTSGSKSLKPDTVLEPSVVYFLLPYSILPADVSPGRHGNIGQTAEPEDQEGGAARAKVSFEWEFLGQAGRHEPYMCLPVEKLTIKPGKDVSMSESREGIRLGPLFAIVVCLYHIIDSERSNSGSRKYFDTSFFILSLSNERPVNPGELVPAVRTSLRML